MSHKIQPPPTNLGTSNAIFPKTGLVIEPCRRDSRGEIIDPFERPIIVSKSASVDSKDDNDNLFDLMPLTISDRTKQVPQLESWKSQKKSEQMKEIKREQQAATMIKQSSLGTLQIYQITITRYRNSEDHRRQRSHRQCRRLSYSCES